MSGYILIAHIPGAQSWYTASQIGLKYLWYLFFITYLFIHCEIKTTNWVQPQKA